MQLNHSIKTCPTGGAGLHFRPDTELWLGFEGLFTHLFLPYSQGLSCSLFLSVQKKTKQTNRNNTHVHAPSPPQKRKKHTKKNPKWANKQGEKRSWGGQRKKKSTALWQQDHTSSLQLPIFSVKMRPLSSSWCHAQLSSITNPRPLNLCHISPCPFNSFLELLPSFHFNNLSITTSPPLFTREYPSRDFFQLWCHFSLHYCPGHPWLSGTWREDAILTV